jgi:hypothetical protein
MTDHPATQAAESAMALLTSRELHKRFGDRWAIDRDLMTELWTAERRSHDGRHRRFLAARHAADLIAKLDAAEADERARARREASRPLLRGERVEAVSLGDDYRRFALTAGDLGTVEFTDSIGTVHVRWDSGARVGIIAEDRQMIRSDSAN